MVRPTELCTLNNALVLSITCAFIT